MRARNAAAWVGIAQWIAGVGVAAPVLGTPEEVLSGDVRVPYADSSNWRFVRVDRRHGAGAWRELGVFPKDTAFVDTALPAPSGTYEYRMQKCLLSFYCDPTWSNVATFTARSECSGQAAWSVPAGYTPLDPDDAADIVEITCGLGTNGNPDCDGADVYEALKLCSARGGCILEAEPTTYTDVSIVITRSADTSGPCVLPDEPLPNETLCLGSDTTFPRGLILQGYGSQSVFQSPLWTTPYIPRPLLAILGRGQDSGERTDIRLRVRNLTLDGRKDEQMSPTADGSNPSPTPWDQRALWVGGLPWIDESHDGCVHNLTIENFLNHGVSLQNVRNWIVEDSRIIDTGCYDAISPCPGFEAPNVVVEANDPEHNPLGWVARGFAVVADRSDGLVIRANQIERATSYGVEIKAGNSGGFGADIADVHRNLVVQHNAILDTGFVGIFLSGTDDAQVTDNVVDRVFEPEGISPEAYSNFGVMILGPTRSLHFERNQIRDTSGVAISFWPESDSADFAAAENFVSDNLLDGSCLTKNPSNGFPYASIDSPRSGVQASGWFELLDDAFDSSDAIAVNGVWLPLGQWSPGTGLLETANHIADLINRSTDPRIVDSVFAVAANATPHPRVELYAKAAGPAGNGITIAESDGAHDNLRPSGETLASGLYGTGILHLERNRVTRSSCSRPLSFADGTDQQVEVVSGHYEAGPYATHVGFFRGVGVELTNPTPELDGSGNPLPMLQSLNGAGACAEFTNSWWLRFDAHGGQAHGFEDSAVSATRCATPFGGTSYPTYVVDQ